MQSILHPLLEVSFHSIANFTQLTLCIATSEVSNHRNEGARERWHVAAHEVGVAMENRTFNFLVQGRPLLTLRIEDALKAPKLQGSTSFNNSKSRHHFAYAVLETLTEKFLKTLTEKFLKYYNMRNICSPGLKIDRYINYT